VKAPKGWLLMALALAALLTAGGIGQLNAGAVSKSRSALAAFCAEKQPPTGPVSSKGQHIVAVATFKKGTTFKEATTFTLTKLGVNVDHCFALSEIDSIDGRQVLHVLGSQSQDRSYRSFIMAYLKHSRLFTSVEAGEGIWQS